MSPPLGGKRSWSSGCFRLRWSPAGASCAVSTGSAHARLAVLGQRAPVWRFRSSSARWWETRHAPAVPRRRVRADRFGLCLSFDDAHRLVWVDESGFASLSRRRFPCSGLVAIRRGFFHGFPSVAPFVASAGFSSWFSSVSGILLVAANLLDGWVFSEASAAHRVLRVFDGDAPNSAYWLVTFGIAIVALPYLGGNRPHGRDAVGSASRQFRLLCAWRRDRTVPVGSRGLNLLPCDGTGAMAPDYRYRALRRAGIHRPCYRLRRPGRTGDGAPFRGGQGEAMANRSTVRVSVRSGSALLSCC